MNNEDRVIRLFQLLYSLHQSSVYASSSKMPDAAIFPDQKQKITDLFFKPNSSEFDLCYTGIELIRGQVFLFYKHYMEVSEIEEVVKQAMSPFSSTVANEQAELSRLNTALVSCDAKVANTKTKIGEVKSKTVAVEEAVKAATASKTEKEQDLTNRFHKLDQDGNTPIHKLLLAKVQKGFKVTIEQFTKIVSLMDDLYIPNKDDKIPLQLALQLPDFAKILLSKHAETANSQTFSKFTPHFTEEELSDLSKLATDSKNLSMQKFTQDLASVNEMPVEEPDDSASIAYSESIAGSASQANSVIHSYDIADQRDFLGEESILDSELHSALGQ